MEEKHAPVISGSFWAQNFSNSVYYKVDAQLLAQNDKCYVWVEKNSGVTQESARYVANLYKNEIYDEMMDYFGYEINIKDKGKTIAIFNNIEFANWLAKGEKMDSKLTILLLDIKDNYRKGINDSYVAGYFWAGNIYDKEIIQNSNECDMIYLDVNPGIPGSKDSNETLAHELQHLMNIAGAVVRGSPTDLWIDEGLSVTAEWVYSQDHSYRIDKYNDNEDASNLLGLGNNFFVWGNREGSGEGESQYAVLDDYSTVYLFFQWLRLQSDKDIFRKISSSKSSDYTAVIDAFNEVVTGSGYDDWETMLKDWLTANYKRENSGRYGYRNETKLNSITVHYAPGGSTTINLFPGEGVYSKVTNLTSVPEADENKNIMYAGLDDSKPVNYGAISSGDFSTGALLTYNASTDINGAFETGIITGEAPPSASIVSAPSGRRSLNAGNAPFRIGAGDLLKQPRKKNFSFSNDLEFEILSADRNKN